MKKNYLIAIVMAIMLISCKQKSDNNKSGNESKDKVAQMGETGVQNAGKAKSPKGKLSCMIDGVRFVATENTVQCMFIGMNKPDYAQGMISCSANGVQVTATIMGKPAIGTFKGVKTGDPIGLSITKEGTQYSSMLGGNVTISVTNITPDGANYYIGGNFSGSLKSPDGKIMTVTDGVFESAYL
jgi:hypothetical protein